MDKPLDKCVTIQELETSFEEEIIKTGGTNIRLCHQCGKCVASCPLGRRSSFRVREIIRKAMLGFREEVLYSSDIWLCTTCYTCHDRCPKGVNVTDIILTLRRLAVREKGMLPQHSNIVDYLIKTGHSVPINEDVKKLRAELGLNPLPPTTHQYEEALIDIQTISKLCKLDILIQTKK